MNKKKNDYKTILFLTPRMSIGGAQRYVIEKAKWLTSNKYNIIVCSEDGVWVHKNEITREPKRVKLLIIIYEIKETINKFATNSRK